MQFLGTVLVWTLAVASTTVLWQRGFYLRLQFYYCFIAPYRPRLFWTAIAGALPAFVFLCMVFVRREHRSSQLGIAVLLSHGHYVLLVLASPLFPGSLPLVYSPSTTFELVVDTAWNLVQRSNATDVWLLLGGSLMYSMAGYYLLGILRHRLGLLLVPPLVLIPNAFIATYLAEMTEGKALQYVMSHRALLVMVEYWQWIGGQWAAADACLVYAWLTMGMSLLGGAARLFRAK